MKDILLQLSTPSRSEDVLKAMMVNEAIARLPSPEQTAVRAKYGLEHLSLAEMAIAQGLSEKTVERRLARGLARLRVFLDAE